MLKVNDSGTYKDIHELYKKNSSSGYDYIGELYKSDGNGGYSHIFSAGYDTTVTGNPATMSNARAKSLAYELSGNSKRTIEISSVEYTIPNEYTLLDNEGSTATAFYCKRNSDSATGTIDLTTGVFTASTFTAGNELPTPDDNLGVKGVGDKCNLHSEVPDTYTELEYIQSTGTQYIDTGYAKPNTAFEIKAKVSFNDTTSRYLLGTSSSSPNYCGRHSNGSFELNQTYTTMVSVVDTIYTLDYKSEGTGTSVSLTVSDGTTSETLSCNRDSVVSTNHWYVFAINDTGTAIYRLNGKIYQFILYDNASMVRAFIPAKNSSGTIGMYDLVTKAFFTNAGTGVFTAGPEVHILPDEYTRLEYLKSTGTQWINTNIDSDSGSGIKIKYEYTAASNENSPISASGGSMHNVLQYYNGSQNVYMGAARPTYSVTATINTVYETEINTNLPTVSCSINGTALTPATGQATAFGNVGQKWFLFCRNNSGTATGKSVKIYYCELYEGAVLVANFVPAKRNSDSVIGMYDTVSKTFFTNAGTGTFTAGPEISGITIYKTQEFINPSVVTKQLPSEYSQLEYIQTSTAKTYINTGISDYSNLKMSSTLQVTEAYANTNYIEGTYSGGTYFNYMSAQNIQTAFGSGYTNYGLLTWDTDKHTFVFENDGSNATLNIDGLGSVTLGTAITGGSILVCGTSASNTLITKHFEKLFWRNGTLIMALIPAKRTSDNAIGMYDTVNDVFYTNAGTGTFIAGPVVSVPSEYTELKYIEADGASYINTGLYYNPTLIPSIKVEYNLHTDVARDNKFFGSYSGIGLTVSASKLRSAVNSNWGWNLCAMTLDDHIDEFTYDGTNIYLHHDGTLVHTVATTVFTDTLPLLIGRLNHEESYAKYTKFYRVRIGTAGEFIPAKRNSDSAIGMYDTVTNTFFTNQGTGTFIAGPEVTVKHMNKMCLLYYPSADITGLTTQSGTPTPTAPIYPTSVEPYSLNGISTYLDTYTASTHQIVRNVGIKVLDGTETWTGSDYFMTSISDMMPLVYGPGCCSHFTIRSGTSNIADIQLGANSRTIFIFEKTSKPSGVTDVTTWKAWLAAQYAAGTPVIIYYPLATATTETASLLTKYFTNAVIVNKE